MRKRIYGYYKPILQVDQTEQFTQANLWKASWERMGWECVMLNQSHASASPYLSVILNKLFSAARSRVGMSEVIATKLQARFGRWCALFGAGGGWMSDYDVVNLGFTPAMAEEIERNTDIAVNTDGPAWIIFSSHKETSEACKDFAERDLFKKDNSIEPEPEAKILKIKKNFFKDIEELAHVFGENKSGQMRDLLVRHYGDGQNTITEKPRNRK